jgi:hypothetical protein
MAGMTAFREISGIFMAMVIITGKMAGKTPLCRVRTKND